jgi:hypothetical protein
MSVPRPTRDRQRAPDPPSPITVTMMGVRSAISLQVAADRFRLSAFLCRYRGRPGVSMKVNSGSANLAASFINRSACDTPGAACRCGRSFP